MFDKPDETTNENQNNERVGFCQDCGRPLTRETVRVVGSGLFCESCLEARLAGTTQATSSTTSQATGAGAGVPPPPVPPLPSEPSPLLAWFLGLIPGVGAMYNGQFAKGIVHLIVFAVLVSLADSVNGIFGLFVAGWVFYQAFEAYHTAKARIEGRPLPNAFGFNDIGDRMGFGKNWPGSATRPPATPLTSWTPGQPAAGTPPPPSASWTGYVPPTQFSANFEANAAAQHAATAEAMAESIRQQAYRDAGYSAAPPPPYAQTFTGADSTDTFVPPAAPARRFPTGAIWLIALGLIFLLANIDSSFFHISGRWLFPALLAGLSLWVFFRRLGWLGGANHQTGSAAFVCMLRGPVMLMTLAVLFALQAAHVWTFGQTWPVLVILFGAILLLERSVGRPAYVPPPSSFIPGTPQPAGHEVPVTEPRVPQWTSADDPAKGGQ